MVHLDLHVQNILMLMNNQSEREISSAGERIAAGQKLLEIPEAWYGGGSAWWQECWHSCWVSNCVAVIKAVNG